MGINLVHSSVYHQVPCPAVLQGTFAKVKYGQHVDTGETVAIKVQHRRNRVSGQCQRMTH